MWGGGGEGFGVKNMLSRSHLPTIKMGDDAADPDAFIGDPDDLVDAFFRSVPNAAAARNEVAAVITLGHA